jgi:uroporphyrinogen-III decarboxylase
MKALADFKKLPALGASEWYGRFLDICGYMLKRTSGAGIPFMRGFFSPLDLAGALRGEGIYYDFYDEPALLHEFLDFCADCTIKFAKDLYALCEKYLGESKYGMFFLDGINMSEDIACMISADLYREFCAPYTQKVIDAFGKGYMHCHSRAMYLVKEICSLNNVATLWLATDPNQPRPIEHLETLVADADSVCLNIDCDDFSEIEKNAHSLKKGNFSICLPVGGLKEAEACTDRFKRIFGG